MRLSGRFAEGCASKRPSTLGIVLCILAALPLAAGAQNILNNGGFENGSMCYLWWTWSTTGVDFAGDYRYTLSPDSHSGNYSFQIACLPGGTDCAQAALISNEVPATPNQSYILSAWVKCPRGSGSLGPTLLVLDNLGSSQFSIGTCAASWTKITLKFQLAPTADSFNIRVYTQGAPAVLVDDVVLTYGDGTAPARTNLHSGTRNVSISGQTVLVDGAPYLALGFYAVPWSDIGAAAATGANTINAVSGAGAGCFNFGSKGYLDAIYEAGMNFLPDSTSTAVAGNQTLFPSILQTFGPHLANIGWGLASEADLSQLPAYNYVSPQQLLADKNAASLVSPLPMVNLMQHITYLPGDDVAYAPSTDIWMAEPYGPDFSLVSSATSSLNAIAPKPIWLAEDDAGASLIVPKAYWSIVNGATGIFYFNWAAFKAEPDQMAAATQVFSELKSLQGAIFGSKMDLLVTPPSGITTMSRFNQGAAYILAVNPNASSVQGKFTVQGMTAGQQVSVMFENRNITASAGGFTDSFAGIGRHVYSFVSPNTTLSSSITNKTGSTGARVWTIQAFNSGLAAANSAAVTNLVFKQTGGTACTPAIIGGGLPLSLGTINPGVSATGNLTLNFTGCDSTSKFTVVVSVSANGGNTSANTTFANQRF